MEKFKILKTIPIAETPQRTARRANLLPLITAILENAKKQNATQFVLSDFKKALPVLRTQTKRQGYNFHYSTSAAKDTYWGWATKQEGK